MSRLLGLHYVLYFYAMSTQSLLYSQCMRMIIVCSELYYVGEGTMAVDDDKVPEVLDLAASTSLAEAAELPSPGIVQILPPVMGSRFESPGETTDEETDSPRSSEGFAYPDSDAMALPYSGQIMYPSRFSSAQASNGPNLLQYSGSMSLRSDSSTTSNRSFAFPM